MSFCSDTPLKILIADDDPIARLLLKTFLVKNGHVVIEATNGREAFDAFDLHNPDLVLMDVIMPAMTGYETARLIKQKSSSSFVPIIFLTSLNDDESLVKCIESGGDDFLAKPVNRVLLTAKINAMLRIRHINRELEVFKQRTEEEIELTRHVFDSLTKRMGSSIAPELMYWFRPAGHFSGDLMIYDKSPSGKLYIMLGDFTGHGFSAAIGALPTSDIFFAMTKREFKTLDILAEINRKLYEIMPSSHFYATAFVCFDSKNRLLEVFNGGLPTILLLDRERNLKASIKSSNLALGILPPELFEAEVTSLDSDEGTLVLYTDGITEAQDMSGDMFGEERLYAALHTQAEPFESAKTALEAFIGDTPLADDISLLVLSI